MTVLYVFAHDVSPGGDCNLRTGSCRALDRIGSHPDPRHLHLPPGTSPETVVSQVLDIKKPHERISVLKLFAHGDSRRLLLAGEENPLLALRRANAGAFAPLRAHF